MPTKKIRDLPTHMRPCLSHDHNPPSHMVFPPGVYEHTCSGCGRKITFVVDKPVWCAPGRVDKRKSFTWSAG